MTGGQVNLHVALALALGRPPSASNKVLLADVEELMRQHRGRGGATHYEEPSSPGLFDLEQVAS